MSRNRKSLYTKQEMMKLMNVNKSQNYVFMPNEIYSDFRNAFADLKVETEKNARSSHVAYAFGYTFLAHYMWRYAQYSNWDNAAGEVPINEAVVKQLLGFGAKSEAYTYLTKNKTGLLEQINYIRKVTDKPIAYYYQDEEENQYKEPAFVMESESGSPDKTNNKNWKVSMPIKGLWRKPEDETNVDKKFENGTFFEIENTHMVDMDTFIYCITHPELGVEGFYLYNFLRFMTDKFPMGYDCSKKKMVHLTGLSLDEVKNQIDNLERYNMITNDHKPWCQGKPDDKDPKANTYTIKEFEEFATNLMQMNVIPKQCKVSPEQYEKEIGWANEYMVDDKLVNTKTGEIIKKIAKVVLDDDEDMGDMPWDK